MSVHRMLLPLAVFLGIGSQAPAATPVPSAASVSALPAAVLERNAATGNPEAEVALGRRLMKSKDPADKAAAAKWYREAAMQGNPEAQWQLGSAYLAGAGVPRDGATGFTWMRKSLSDGNADHMGMYGYMLAITGFMSGNQQQVQDGVKWIRQGAKAGSSNSMTALAMFSLGGKMGMTKDTHAAEQWMLQAARAGDAGAQSMLGQMYVLGSFGHPDVQAGLDWLDKAADQGNANAEGMLGYWLITGEKNVPKDPAAGARWAAKAAAQHDGIGYYALGYAYQHGSGEPMDPAKAWYNFAAAERVDMKHQFADVGERMSAVATQLSAAQLAKLQTAVAKIPVPKKGHAKVIAANGN